MVDEHKMVESYIHSVAKMFGWDVTENLNRITKAKLRFFGIDGWHKCPCYKPTETQYGCGTKACREQIERDGICHCNLFKVRGDK